MANIVFKEGEVGTNTYTYTMPAGHYSKVEWVHVQYTSSATAGNRQLRLDILNPSDVIRFDGHAGTTQAASLVRHYSFMRGIFRETSFADGELQIAIPQALYIPPGYKIKIHDSANVSASDSMIINMQYRIEPN